MRIGPKLLIAVGAADLLIAFGATMLYSLAYASQYSGFVSWLYSLSPGIAPGSPEHAELMSGVLRVLGRTSTPFFVVTIALAVSGVVLIVAGWRANPPFAATSGGTE